MFIDSVINNLHNCAPKPIIVLLFLGDKAWYRLCMKDTDEVIGYTTPKSQSGCQMIFLTFPPSQLRIAVCVW